MTRSENQPARSGVIAGITGIALLVLSFAPPLNAQGDYSSENQSQVQSVRTAEISGEVLRKDGNKFTIDTDSGVKEVIIPDNIKVTSNTFEARAADIRPRDKVTVRQTENGQLVSVDVTQAQVYDWGKVLIPLAVGAVLVIFLIKTAANRANKPHIKTAVS